MSATATTVPELASHVAGAWRKGPTEIPDTNPARPREVVATTSLADADLATEAIEAATTAFPSWRSTPAPARGEMLRRAAELLDTRARDIGRDLTREQGKTLAESVRETQLAAKVFRYYAAQTLDPDGETYPSHNRGMLLYARREPVGVVSAITPWNFPISIPAWKLAPALAFGNTVVWKPAEIVPLTAVHLTEVLIDAGVPEGVVNLVLGKGSHVGDTLVTHPAVGAVTFTGSTAVGLGIQTRAAGVGKKVQLELGGNNPAVILGDANLELAAEQVSTGAFGATGQKCTATSRVIVERPVVAEFVDRLSKHAENWALGDPLNPTTTMGPLASADQFETVVGHLERAQKEGSRATTGDARPDGPLADGYFVRPTVLVDVEPDHTIAREEVFGPVAAILPVDSYDEAVAVANDTPYGLSASLFTNDLAKALLFADESRSGLVRINQGTSGMEYHAPFGGTKDSVRGSREQGKAAREFFTESKTVYIGLP
ncbi:MAG: aldehyde dehydrogenase family protein [Acidimicrobiales bacterium]